MRDAVMMLFLAVSACGGGMEAPEPMADAGWLCPGVSASPCPNPAAGPPSGVYDDPQACEPLGDYCTLVTTCCGSVCIIADAHNYYGLCATGNQ